MTTGSASTTRTGARHATRCMRTPRSSASWRRRSPRPSLSFNTRRCETAALPAADRSGAVVLGLDLHAHEVFVEHSGGASRRVALTPDRPVGDVTREVLAAVSALGGPTTIDPTPQEVWWTTRLD